MNKQTTITVAKSVIIILILLAVVFALRAPAADLNILPNEIKGDYVDSSGPPYFSEMDSYYNLRLTEDYVDHGFVGDIDNGDGTYRDMHRYAPDGNIINYELGIVYLTSFLHDMANKFFGNCSHFDYCSSSKLLCAHIPRIFRYRYVLLHILAVLYILLC